MAFVATSSVTSFPLWFLVHAARVHRPVMAPVAQMLISRGKMFPGVILHAAHNFDIAEYLGRMTVIFFLISGCIHIFLSV